MKKMISMLILSTMALSCAAKKVDNSTVSSLSLNRYLGRWYEIARYDHVFERDLQYATANYSLMKNGKVKVVNSGMKGNTVKTSEGKAKLTETEGLLRVSFFGPFYSDYRVMMLDPDYQYVLVGSKTSNYLWILSRTPELPGNTIQAILAEAQRRGYDTKKLIWVDQIHNTKVEKL